MIVFVFLMQPYFSFEDVNVHNRVDFFLLYFVVKLLIEDFNA